MIVEVLDWVTDDSSLLLWEFKSWNEGWNQRGAWIFCGFAIEIWILFIYLFYRYKDLSLLYFDGIAWFDLY